MFNIFAFTFKIVSWTYVFFFTFTIFQRLSVVCNKNQPKKPSNQDRWLCGFLGFSFLWWRFDLGTCRSARCIICCSDSSCLCGLTLLGLATFVFFFCMVKLVKDITPGKTNMAMEHPQFLIGDASSNGWCSISVFPGVHQRLVPVPPIFKYTHFSTSMIPW